MYDVQSPISLETDYIPYPSSKGKDAIRVEPDLFFAPDPDTQLAFAPSPESFDRDFDKEEFDLELSFKEFDNFFATLGHTIPVAPTPSAVTDSTDSTESVYSSQYSCSLTPSEYSSVYQVGQLFFSTNQNAAAGCEQYPIPSEPYNTYPSVYSAAFSDPLPSIPPGSPGVKAVAVQESDEAHKVHGPVKLFKCYRCSFSSARKYNLQTHVLTHDKERLKPFGCDTCKSRFTRRHDLRRHREKIHDEQISSSSSVSSVSKRILKRTVDPMPERPDLSHRGITLNGDPTPILSATTGLPENIIAWLLGV